MSNVKTEERQYDIEDVLNALSRVIDATNEHDRQFREHVEGGGYSWGYYGAALISERDRAREDLAARLNSYIDQRIAKALSER